MDAILRFTIVTPSPVTTRIVEILFRISRFFLEKLAMSLVQF